MKPRLHTLICSTRPGRVMPMLEAVAVMNVAQHLKDHAFVPAEVHQASGTAMLDELPRWTGALRTLRVV